MTPFHVISCGMLLAYELQRRGALSYERIDISKKSYFVPYLAPYFYYNFNIKDDSGIFIRVDHENKVVLYKDNLDEQ